MMFIIRKTDYVISVALILIFLAPVVSSYNTLNSGLKAVITAGNYVKTLDLTYTGAFVFPGFSVEISNNSIHIADSNCPNHICVNSGSISKPGEVIVCVPNRVMIEIQGSKATAGFDAVAY